MHRSIRCGALTGHARTPSDCGKFGDMCPDDPKPCPLLVIIRRWFGDAISRSYFRVFVGKRDFSENLTCSQQYMPAVMTSSREKCTCDNHRVHPTFMKILVSACKRKVRSRTVVYLSSQVYIALGVREQRELPFQHMIKIIPLHVRRQSTNFLDGFRRSLECERQSVLSPHHHRQAHAMWTTCL